MSNELTLFNAPLPAYIRGEDADTKALAGSGGMRRLSIKGGVFREMIGGQEHRAIEERSLNVAVVRVAPHNSRQYFAGTYVEGEKAAPVCWSSDGQKPDADVKNKQAPNCMNCPQNVKGSGQGDSRACRFQRRLAVVLDGAIENREVYQLICPATSVFGEGERGKMPLQKYAQFLNAHRTPITAIVTELRFDTASTQPKLYFKPVRPLTEAEYAVVQELRDSPEAVNAVTLNVAQTDGHQELPALFDKQKAEEEFEQVVPVAKEEKPKKAKPEAEPEVAEPKKAPSKKPAAEPKLADLVGEWDDE
jgi:hypothetical protein